MLSWEFSHKVSGCVLFINRIKRIGRDELNYKAKLSKAHQLTEAKLRVYLRLIVSLEC